MSTDTKPGGQIVRLDMPNRMTVPHRSPPTPKVRGQEVAEVTELRAPWQATDRLLAMLSDRIERDVNTLLTLMPLGEAESAVRAAMSVGVMRATVAEAERNAALRRRAMGDCGND